MESTYGPPSAFARELLESLMLLREISMRAAAVASWLRYFILLQKSNRADDPKSETHLSVASENAIQMEAFIN